MMSLIDERIQNPVEGCLGSLSGNLACGKLIFTVHPRLSVSLHDQDFDGILSFVHKYGRTDLVKDNNVPFSISYLVRKNLENIYETSQDLGLLNVLLAFEDSELDQVISIVRKIDIGNKDIVMTAKSVGDGPSDSRPFEIPEKSDSSSEDEEEIWCLCQA
ncbi:Uncharacterized protein Adt_05423 [Abeliophyllum distichum]|uniref:Uncharacterized protein n=1 Tax=Abeliophyllum distichum TaxID=126358 RepID=A0ABD1V4B2_9LAMI